MPAPQDFEKMIKAIKAQIVVLEQLIRKALSGSGLSIPAPGVVQVDGDLVIKDGAASSDNYAQGVSGFNLDGPSGNAEFNDVTLRGILVGLDTPVQIQTYRSSAQAFSLTVPYVEKAGQNITVPDGCTRAKALLMGRMYAINPNTTGGADTTGTDALYFTAGIDGEFTTATPTGVSGGNGFATTVGMDSFDLAGLTPGSTIRLSVQGSSGYQSIASHPDNYIVGVAAITWLR